MNDENKLIYDFREHGLYNTKANNMKQKFILAIDTLQIECDCVSGEIESIGGYLPLIKASRSEIDLPLSNKETFAINMEKHKYINGVAYDFFNFFPSSKEYLLNKKGFPNLTYDKKNKRILIGKNQRNRGGIEITRNIYFVFDSKGNLSAIIILLDEIIA